MLVRFPRSPVTALTRGDGFARHQFARGEFRSLACLLATPAATTTAATAFITAMLAAMGEQVWI